MVFKIKLVGGYDHQNELITWLAILTNMIKCKWIDGWS